MCERKEGKVRGVNDKGGRERGYQELSIRRYSREGVSLVGVT